MNRLTRVLGWAVVGGITLVHDGGDHLPEGAARDVTIVDRHERASTCAMYVVLTGSTCSTVTTSIG